MPRSRTNRAKVPCLGCGQPSSTSRCPNCAPTYNHRWAALSRAARTAQPWCSRCGSPGPLEVDHIDPASLAAGIQVLCSPCHHEKTAGQGGRADDGPSTSPRRTPPDDMVLDNTTITFQNQHIVGPSVLPAGGPHRVLTEGNHHARDRTRRPRTARATRPRRRHRRRGRPERVSGHWSGSRRATRTTTGWAEAARSKRVLQRDGYRCHLRFPGVCIGQATEADHVIPISQGGADTEANMAAACAPCHKVKSKQESAAGRAARSRRRPTEPHPGLVSGRGGG